MKIVSKIFELLPQAQLRLAVHTVGAGVMLLIAAAGYSFYSGSDSEQEVAWRYEIESGTELLSSRDRITEERDLAESEFLAMTTRLEELTALIPNTAESSHFLAQLAQLGGESKLEIQNFRPGPPEATRNVQQITVQLSGAGRYESICHFLSGLQTLPRLTRVGRLEISPVNEDGLYPVRMELSIFFAADKRASLKVASNE